LRLIADSLEVMIFYKEGITVINAWVNGKGEAQNGQVLWIAFSIWTKDLKTVGFRSVGVPQGNGLAQGFAEEIEGSQVCNLNQQDGYYLLKHRLVPEKGLDDILFIRQSA
jgi:hypothetical protein